MSTAEQSLALQQDALNKADCGRTFSDVEPAARPSGAVEERAGLAAALDYVRAGDTLVVWRLDRLGPTLRHLIAQVNALDARGVGFRSLTRGRSPRRSTRPRAGASSSSTSSAPAQSS